MDERLNLRAGYTQVNGYEPLDIDRDIGKVILYPVEDLQQIVGVVLEPVKDIGDVAVHYLGCDLNNAAKRE